MSDNIGLIDYVQCLVNDDEKTVENFIDKLKKPIEYKSYLKKFKLTRKYFTGLDNILIELGYSGHSDAINEIREFLKDKLRDIDVLDYNSAIHSDDMAFTWCEQHNKDYNEYADAKPSINFKKYVYNFPIKNHFNRLSENTKKIDWSALSCNPSAFGLLMRLGKRKDKYYEWIDWNVASETANDLKYIKKWPGINWVNISKNSAAIDLLKDNQDKIDWDNLSFNNSSGAIDLLKMNPDKINWANLSHNTNPSAIDLLKMNPDKINWWGLAENTSPGAIELLKANPENINWYSLSSNPAAMEILQLYPNKIYWDWLSINPSAIEMLKDHPDNIDWDILSGNPAAIEMLLANPKKINRKRFSSNPAAANYLCDCSHKKINWDALSSNSYNYYAEKVNHFNGMKYFPQSRLIL